MTRVDFYFNVSDKPQKVIELSQKALNKQRRVLVYVADVTQAQVVSDKLWQGNPSSFMPHNLFEHSLFEHSLNETGDVQISSLAVTPILIAMHLNAMPLSAMPFTNNQVADYYQDDVLINLQSEHVEFFSRFRQLIELVGVDEIDKVAARLRYKFYRDRGYEIKSIDTSAEPLM